MKVCMTQFLRKSDFYGYPITLNFEKRTKYRSSLGGCLSLFTIASIVLLTYQGAVQLLQRHVSYVVQQSIYNFEPTIQVIVPKEFNFFIKVSSPLQNKNKTNELFPEFTLKLTQVTKTRDQEQQVQLQTQKCSLVDFQDINNLDFTAQFQMSGLDQFYCPTKESIFSLQGMTQSVEQQYVKFTLSMCQNKNQCLSEKETKDLLEQTEDKLFEITLGFTNSYLDPYVGQLKPLITFQQLLFRPLLEYTRVKTFVQKTTFNVDNSIVPFSKDLEIRNFYNIEKQNIEVQTIQAINKKEVMDIFFMINQEQVNISKSYSKFDTYLAYVGGILQTSIFILAFVVGSYNRFGFYVSLANRLYTFDLQPTADIDEGLSLDQLQQRIHQRVAQVRSSLEKFMQGARKLLTSTRVSRFFQKPQPISQPSITNELVDTLNFKRVDSLDSNQRLSFQQQGLIQSNFDQDFDSASVLQEPQAQIVRKNLSITTLKTHQRYTDNEFDIVNTPGSAPMRPSSGIKNLRVSFKLDAESRLNQSNHSQNDVYVPSHKMNRQTFLESSFNDVMRYSRRIRVTGMYLLTRLMCRRLFYKSSEKLQLLDRAIKMLKRDTDIVNILEKLQDIDKLKKLILSKDQIMVFNYTPKPVVRAQSQLINKRKSIHFKVDAVESLEISMFQQKAMRSEISRKYSLLKGKKKFKTLKSFFKLYKAYDNLYHQRKGATKAEYKINNKLMHLIGDELRDVFEVSYYLEDTTNLLKTQNTNAKIDQMSDHMKSLSSKMITDHLEQRKISMRNSLPSQRIKTS